MQLPESKYILLHLLSNTHSDWTSQQDLHLLNKASQMTSYAMYKQIAKLLIVNNRKYRKGVVSAVEFGKLSGCSDICDS